MEIVSNSHLLKIFSRIDIFKVDLGSNLTGKVKLDNKTSKDDLKIKISDEFIKRYQSMTNRVIYRYGNIGEGSNMLKFYHDTGLKMNEIQVHVNKDLIYELEIDINSIGTDPRTYLSKILEDLLNPNKVDDSVDDEYVKNDEMEESNYHLLHVSSKEPDPEDPPIDMKDKDEYIKAMVERRRKLSKVEMTPELIEFIEKKKQKDREKYGY